MSNKDCARVEDTPSCDDDLEDSSNHRKSSSSSRQGLACSNRRKMRRNPAVLIQWIEDHPLNPYPTKVEKGQLAHYAGMNLRQLNDWFANARRNIKKVGYDKWKKKHSGYSAILSMQDSLSMPFPHPCQWSPVSSSYHHHPHPHHSIPSSTTPTGYFGANNRLNFVSPSGGFGLLPPSGGDPPPHPASIMASNGGTPAYYPHQHIKLSCSSTYSSSSSSSCCSTYNGVMYQPASSTDSTEGSVVHPPGPPVLMENFRHVNSSPRAFKIVNMVSQNLPPVYKIPPASPPVLLPRLIGGQDNINNCTSPHVQCSDEGSMAVIQLKEEAPWSNDQQQRPSVGYTIENRSDSDGNGGAVWGDISSGWDVPGATGGGERGMEDQRPDGSLSKDSSTAEDYYSPNGSNMSNREDGTN